MSWAVPCSREANVQFNTVVGPWWGHRPQSENEGNICQLTACLNFYRQLWLLSMDPWSFSANITALCHYSSISPVSRMFLAESQWAQGSPSQVPGAPPTSSHPKLSWHSNQMSNLFFPIATPDLSASSHPNILSQHFLWNAPYWGQQYLRAIRVSLMPLSPCFLCVSHTSLCAIPPCGFCFSDLRAFVNVISSIWISLLELTLHLGKYFCLWSSTQLAISRARSPIS